MSSNLCEYTLTSTTVAGTLTGGIQDIAALLPLLGTEQCEDHVSSALTKGYFYAAVSPMSLFGSLGLARAGLKAFLASFSIPRWNIVGAQILSDMGFKPTGINLPLIAIDPNDKDGRYLVETRLDKLVEELHIDKTQIEGVVCKTARWNLTMVVLSMAMCMLCMVPYIFLNTEGRSNLPYHTRWTFPTLRAAGGFLTTTITQVIIQTRITNLTRRWISLHCTPVQNQAVDNTPDVEKCSKTTVTDSNSPVTWFLLVLLLFGVLASVVGYVGCFSVVQSAKGSSGPLSWLCLEAGLSLVRMFLWGYNPEFDDAPPLQLILKLDADPPLPTCNAYDDIIMEEKLLPLTRANQFLNSITSFTGVVNRFDHPDVTLYYTLTRAAIPDDSEDTVTDQPYERVLYITVFNHKERTNTRVYTQDNNRDHFYSTESSLPDFDPTLGLLQITLGDEIHTKGDLIAGDDDILLQLRTHYQSILYQLHFNLINSRNDDKYRIENAWTMAMADTTSGPENRRHRTPARGRDLLISLRRARLQKGQLTHDTICSVRRDLQYLQQGRFERTRRTLTVSRGQWVETYMHLCIHKTRQLFNLPGNTRMVYVEGEGSGNENAGAIHAREESQLESQLQPEYNQDPEPEEVETSVIEHLRDMELLLAGEAEFWEEQLLRRVQIFANSDDVSEKERLRVQMEWKTNYRRRIDGDIQAMDARLDAAKLEVRANGSDELVNEWQSAHNHIKSTWQSILERSPKLDDPAAQTSPSNLSHLQRPQMDFQRSAQAIEVMIGHGSPLLNATSLEQLQRQSDRADELSSELEQTLFRIDRPATHLARLTEYKLSQLKWQSLVRFTPRLGVYSRAFGAMTHVIFVSFDFLSSDWVTKLMPHLPSPVTSIYVPHSNRLPAIRRETPLFVNDANGSNKIETFLHDNQSQLAGTRRTHIFIDTRGFSPRISAAGFHCQFLPGPKIAVSFYGPSTGNLVLKLTHSSGDASATLILKEPHGSRSFEYPVHSSTAITTIPLSSSPSSQPPFVPNTRNNLIIEVAQGIFPSYVVQDIQLQDEEGNDHNPASPEG